MEFCVVYLHEHCPLAGSHVFNCANVPDSEHSHGSQPNGLLAFRFQKPSLQRSHWRPSTFCLHKHKTPGMLCRPQPGKSLRTPAGTHLHSSQYGKLNNPSDRETAVRFPLRRKTQKTEMKKSILTWGTLLTFVSHKVTFAHALSCGLITAQTQRSVHIARTRNTLGVTVIT